MAEQVEETFAIVCDASVSAENNVSAICVEIHYTNQSLRHGGPVTKQIVYATKRIECGTTSEAEFCARHLGLKLLINYETVLRATRQQLTGLHVDDVVPVVLFNDNREVLDQRQNRDRLRRLLGRVSQRFGVMVDFQWISRRDPFYQSVDRGARASLRDNGLAEEIRIQGPGVLPYLGN